MFERITMDQKTNPQTSSGLVSRRTFLRFSGAAAAALLAQAGLPTRAFAQAEAQGDVVMMATSSSIIPMIPDFEAAHPGITLTHIDYDTTKFFSMLAAGTPPNLMRTSIPEFPQMYARGIALSLQKYFEASTVLREDDLAWPNDFYKASGKLDIGQGDRYAMTNDFSPDFTLWIDLDKLEEMGVDAPSETDPLTYDQVVELSRKLTKYDGDRLVQTGFAYNRSVSDRYWTAWLNGIDASLFSDDFTSANIVNNPEARDAIAFHYNLSKEGLAFSSKMPDDLGPHGEFATGKAAAVQ
ncbi:MAG: extracellular solute-binding protein [Chloroflexi bacterium]|nr:extracellular solute-binding protein [Chloroflexota bacterium]